LALVVLLVTLVAKKVNQGDSHTLLMQAQLQVTEGVMVLKAQTLVAEVLVAQLLEVAILELVVAMAVTAVMNVTT
jgi:hypothetical protein